MNIFILYDQATGAIKETQATTVTQWTNIPDGWGVIGPYDQATASQAVQEAFGDATNSLYIVQNGQLVQSANYATLKAQQATDAQRTSIADKYDPQIQSAREKLRCAIDEGKPQLTIDKLQSNLKSLLNNKTTEMAGVQ